MIDRQKPSYTELERRLQQSEENFRNSMDSSPLGIRIVNSDGDTTYANRAVLDIYGYVGVDELKATPVKERYTAASYDEHKVRKEKRQRGEHVPPSYEISIVRKDGGIRNIQVFRKEVLWDGQPQFQVLYLDVTERKRAEDALRESEERYRELVENAGEAILVAQDGKLVFVNPMTVKVAGYPSEALMAKPFIEFVHPQDRDMVLERHLKRLKGQEFPPVYAFRIIDGAGNTRWVEFNAVLIKWKGKAATLNFVRDISERRQLEEERQKAARLESVGLLAGGIAHDFNNLLTGIMGNVSLAERLIGATSPAADLLQEVEKACARAKDLTQQLLTFSRGGEPVKTLASITAAITDSATFALRGSKVKCSFDLPDDLWPAEVDVGQVSHVIGNMVINADEAMPQGGILSIAGRNVVLGELSALPLPKGRCVEITIADPGIGIPEALLPKIFDPYFTTKQRGSGLGLATCYSIIKKHGGHITVESKLGVGTTFRIYLPASEKPIQDRRAEAPRGASVARGGRIIVMDDEEIIRKMVVRLLTTAGYEVEAVSDGAAALERYAKAAGSGRPFDAVILDLTVPGGMGGKEAIKKLLEIDPHVKAVISSGYSSDPLLSNFRKYGFCAVVAKPYTIEALEATLQQVLRGA
ncbi:MAG: PAS domain S-box protein, partial [Chloroflexi bacterium]|nr:PAS domain S-box protein [Chloroflexota bacterium]